MKIQIERINQRFKRLAHDHGVVWVAISEPRPMPCFNGEIGVTCHPLNDMKKISNFKVADIQFLGN